MINLSFTNIDDLINFLMDTKEFNEWETTIFRMSCTNGIEMNVNTKINDTAGIKDYIELKKLKLMLQNFYKQNSYLAINLEIKLKFPDTLKKIIDPSNSYNAFYIDFYSDNVVTYANTSFVENTKQLNDKPIKSWTVYIMNLYNTWQNKKQNG